MAYVRIATALGSSALSSLIFTSWAWWLDLPSSLALCAAMVTLGLPVWCDLCQMAHLLLLFHCTVYLRSSPKVCLERLQRRGRTEEKPVTLVRIESWTVLGEGLGGKREVFCSSTCTFVCSSSPPSIKWTLATHSDTILKSLASIESIKQVLELAEPEEL